jgi:CheY-like chemotaxis protein
VFRSFYVAPCTVFVVEDDVDTRDMMGRFLELEGFTVEVAANGKQALERLNAGMLPCVILLDLMMPVMDGWQFRSQQIRDAALASIPVIVVSAAGKDRIADIEANAYLSKPVDLEQLLAEVSQYCSTR